VLVDAPCTGSGTWRRRPDSKWRIRPEAIVQRQIEQRAVLETAAGLVKAGGQLTYVTCSVLPEENGDQVAWFLAHHEVFRIIPYDEVWRERLGSEPPASADKAADGALLLTPASHGTDGFFIACFAKSG
jgi:16S rRNA (cytosine967-C5)-methyltransferase